MRGIVLLVAVTAALSAALALGFRGQPARRLMVVGLLILTAPLEIYRTNVGPFNVSIFRFALLLALCALALDLWRRRGDVRPRVRLPVPFAAYGLVVAIQVISALFVTTNGTLAYRYLLQYLAGLCAAGVVVHFVRRSDARRLSTLWLLAAILPALAAVWRIFSRLHGGNASLPGLSLLPVDPTIAASRGDATFLLGGAQRMQSTFEDPNHFGFYCATVLIVGVALLFAGPLAGARGDQLRWRLAVAFGCGTSALLLIGSYSRSAWLLAAVAGALFVILFRPQLQRVLAAPRTRAAVLASVLALGIVIVPVVAARVGDPGSSISNAKHTETMSLATHLAYHHPLVGVGLGSYGGYAGEPKLVSSSHSTFLTVAAELGAPGLLALIATMALTIWVGAVALRRPQPPEQKALLAGVVASYIGLVVANAVYEVWYDDFQWVLFGLMVALSGGPSLLLRRVPGHVLPRLSLERSPVS